MRNQRIVIYSGLALAWCAFALWQYRTFQQQEDLVEESLRQQAQSIMTATVGGMRSHRRLGRFFEEQLQGMIDELVKSHDVVYVAIRTSDGEELLSAGDPRSSGTAHTAGDNQESSPRPSIFFRLVSTFELSSAPAGPLGPGGGGGGGGGRVEPSGRMGRGMEAGLGSGRGRGAGPRGREVEGAPAREPLSEGIFGAGGSFVAELVLDRVSADELTHHVARSHALAVIAAGMVALSIGLVWRATMNLTEAKGRAPRDTSSLGGFHLKTYPYFRRKELVVEVDSTGLLPIPESKETLFECFKEDMVPTEYTKKPDAVTEAEDFFKLDM